MTDQAKTGHSGRQAAKFRQLVYLLAFIISLCFFLQLLSMLGLSPDYIQWFSSLTKTPWSFVVWISLSAAMMWSFVKFWRADKGDLPEIREIAFDLLRAYLSEQVTYALARNKARKEILPTFYDQVLCGFDVSLKYAIGGLPIKTKAQVTDITVNPERDPSRPTGYWTGTVRFICRVQWPAHKDPKKTVQPYLRDHAVPVRLAFVVSKKHTEAFKKKSIQLAYFGRPTGRVFQNVTLTYILCVATLACSLTGLAASSRWVFQ